MAMNDTTPTNGDKIPALIDLIITTYEEIAVIDDARLDKLKMQLIRAYAQALRERASIKRAAKAAALKTGAKQGGKK